MAFFLVCQEIFFIFFHKPSRSSWSFRPKYLADPQERADKCPRICYTKTNDMTHRRDVNFMDHIKDELSHLGGMSSNDAFDLLTLGLFPDEEPEEEAPEEEDIVQHVSPLTDIDSLDFYLWVEEGAQAEADRRQNKPSKPPKAE